MKPLLPLFITAIMTLGGISQSVVVIELGSSQPLLELKANKKRPVASLTKIATAVVALDWARKTHTPLTVRLNVPPEISKIGGASALNLNAGDQLSLYDALQAALICSDNKAAYTISNYVGAQLLKKPYSEKRAQKRFVAEMNQLAKALDMKKTNFRNSTGLDSAKERGKSSARDLAKLCQFALKDKLFREIVNTSQTTAKKYSTERAHSFKLLNTNQLVGKSGIIGVKTGTTHFAGECLAVAQTKGNKTLLCILLKSENRFQQAEAYLADGWRRLN